MPTVTDPNPSTAIGGIIGILWFIAASQHIPPASIDIGMTASVCEVPRVPDVAIVTTAGLGTSSAQIMGYDKPRCPAEAETAPHLYAIRRLFSGIMAHRETTKRLASQILQGALPVRP